MFKFPPKNSKDIDLLIEEIIKEIPNFSFSEEHLTKFHKNNKEDMEFLSYLNGTGGEYVKFLSLLMRKTQPELVVELGNREWVSTIGIAESAISYGGKFITIDIVKDLRYFPESLNDEKKNIFTIFGDVFNLNIFDTIPFDIDILFSDTIHYNEQIRDEFEIYQHLLSDTALVAIDDIHVNDKWVFFDEIDFPKWDLTNLCHHSGWWLFLFQRKEELTQEERINSAMKASISVYQRRYQKFVDDQEILLEKDFKTRMIKNLKKTPIYPILLPAYLKLYKLIKWKK